MAASFVEGQETVATEAVPPFLHVTFAVAPAAMLAMPPKSHVLGAAGAHLGGLVIQAHLAETLLMPAWRKRKGSKFATAAPKRVALMFRMTAITKHLVSTELEKRFVARLRTQVVQQCDLAQTIFLN